MSNTHETPTLDVEPDDAIIGAAVRYSVAVLATVAVLAGIGVVLWRLNQPAPVVVAPRPVELPTVRTAVDRPLPLVPFQDVTRSAGIEFVHVNGSGPEKLLPETMGGGCAFLDYDSDGDADILFVNSKEWRWNNSSDTSSTLALYQNDGTGNYADVTREAGLDLIIYGQGCAVGDFDNDGDPDLYVTAVAENAIIDSAAQGPGPNRLFRNDGGKFVDITQGDISGKTQDWGTSCGWFDFDRDGDLDLWVCNYVAWSREFDIKQNFTLTGGERAYGRPQVFGGTYCRLYRNDGDETFVDVSETAGLHINNPTTAAPTGKSLGVAFCDFDKDQWLDVVITNDTVQNFLFRNRGDGTFEEIAAISGLAFDSNGSARGAMGVDIGCVRNDPQCACVAIGNFANEMTAFYVSYSDSTQFVDEAIANGIGPSTRLFLTFGVLFFDADLDGLTDLFHANGHLEQDISKVQASQTYEQAPQLFWNAGNTSGTEFVPLAAAQLGPDFGKPMVGRGASYADIDGDGDLDLLIAATGQRPRLLRNNQQLGNNWLRIKLEGNGTTSNRDAIGADVRVTLTDGSQLTRLVSPTRSYLSQVELPVTLGLGTQQVQQLSIIWPDGTVQELDAPQVNQVLKISQP